MQLILFLLIILDFALATPVDFDEINFSPSRDKDAPRLFYKKYGIKSLEKLTDYDLLGSEHEEFRKGVIQSMSPHQLSHSINLAAHLRAWGSVEFLIQHGTDASLLKYSVRRMLLHGQTEDLLAIRDLIGEQTLQYKKIPTAQLKEIFEDSELPMPSREHYHEGYRYPSAVIDNRRELGRKYNLFSRRYLIINDETTAAKLDDYLMFATIYGQTRTVKKLLAVGADVEYGTDFGLRTGPVYTGKRVTALLIAASAGFTNIMKALIEAGADLNVQDYNGLTALATAAANGQIEAVKLLIEAGADLDIRDKYDSNALIRATSDRHSEIARMLIEAGAEVNWKDGDGNTALSLAIEYKDIPAIESLLKAGAKGDGRLKSDLQPLLTDAFYARSGEALKQFAKAGVDLNVRDRQGMTLLARAVCAEDVHKVQILIESGADVNTPVLDGENRIRTTPLVEAVLGGNVEIVKLLLKHGANVTQRDDNVGNALDYAHVKGNDEILQLLWRAQLPHVPIGLRKLVTPFVRALWSFD